MTKEEVWTVFTTEHKIHPQTKNWVTTDFLSADRHNTVTLLRHICLDGPELLFCTTDTRSCRTSSGPLYQTATPDVTTEITIECLRVCKWQHSFTFRSVGKVDCCIGNWIFLKPKTWEWTSTEVTTAQKDTKCPICETVSENWICEFRCAVRKQSNCSYWSYRMW